MKDEMLEVVTCKSCNQPEYYGDMRWKNGRCMCRSCYKADWEYENKKLYPWDDLDGERPKKATE